MDLKTARQIVSELSKTDKMPGFSYSLPTSRCVTGQKLAKIKGTVCHACYARRGRYVFRNVRNALERRAAAIENPLWVEAMAFCINYEASKKPENRYFRWHDSGDLQSTLHLRDIIRICKKTPKVKHWLPTKEYGMVVKVLGDIECPKNLVIRLSAHYVDKPVKMHGALIGTVHTDPLIFPQAWHCPAGDQGHKCGDCRACWDRRVRHVSYPKTGAR
jgi:hypothetical protein